MRRSAPHARAERTHRGAGGASFGRSWRGEWSTTVVSVRRLMVLALTGTALVGSLSGSFPALAQPASPQQGSAPPSSKPIPIPEIAQRAEDVATLLRQSTERVGADRDVRDVEGGLLAASEWIRERLLRSTRVLTSASSPNTLTNLTESWQLMRARLTAWNVTLTGNARRLERELDQLEAVRATWSATRAAAASSVPASLLERIDETLRAIDTARQRVGDAHASVLALQDRLFQGIARCDDVLATIEQARRERIRPLFTRDSPPIWQRETYPLPSTDLNVRFRESLGDMTELTRAFFVDRLARVPIQVALFVVVFLMTRQAGARRRGEMTPTQVAATRALDLPLASALVVALLATRWIYPQAPRVVTNIVGLLILVPAVLIVRRLTSPALVSAVYAVGAFFLIDRIREACWSIPLLEQWLFLLEMGFGIGLLALAFSSARVRGEDGGPAPVGGRSLRGLLGGLIIALASAVVVGALGFMRLARVLGDGVLISSYVALVLYATVRVAQELVAYVLRTRPIGQLFMVQRYRDLIQHRLDWVLRWIAAGAWAYVTLDRLNLTSSVGAAGAAVLDVRYIRGSLSLSLGDVVAFGLTIWAALLLSSVARFVLQEDVYPRLGLSRGAPYAVSTLVHYAVLLVGVLLALAALGVDLTRVTILAGAFGVGVGLGLQSVVANFVAGLVLLMESRLHVGDAVQIGDLQGEVRQIGNRASTIRTWDGAEVIVPNSKLTSERFTNWTLSDRMRRVDLPVAVGYAADSGRVLQLLHDVATEQPKVLTAPAPLVLCTGLSDCALHFEVRVWTARFEEAETVRSQLAVAVHRALAAASIEIAFHRYDIHLRDGKGNARDGVMSPSSSLV
jgi:potassium-dependent mechanosensitive channel